MNDYGFIRTAAAVPMVRVADFNYNAEEICRLAQQAFEKEVSLLVFPQLSLTGCTCGSLFGQSTLVKGAEDGVRKILEFSRAKAMTIVVGAPVPYRSRLYDCAVIIRNGNVKGIVPNTCPGRPFASGRDFLSEHVRNDGGLLVDTDYAGTLPAFYKALKQNGIKVNKIKYVLATHYHPDHMGLISDLMKQGAMLILIDVQRDYVHFSDSIFARDRLPYTPIDESLGTVISCSESREFLLRAGISGEIIHTHSHSEDSVSLIMDDGDCFVGDLEPFEYIEVYEENEKLKSDWEHILSFQPKRVFYSHRPERVLD